MGRANAIMSNEMTKYGSLFYGSFDVFRNFALAAANAMQYIGELHRHSTLMKAMKKIAPYETYED